jgi:hypothetical protein
MAYGRDCYGRADGTASVSNSNNAPAGEGGVDSDVVGRLGGKTPGGAKVDSKTKGRRVGICSGITSAWIIGCLNGYPAATATDGFKDYFVNVLRFQGAYMKDFDPKAKTDDFVAQLAKVGFAAGIKLDKLEKVRNVANGGVLPASGSWACYAAVFGHAVGVAADGSKWYLMDPNYGLFVYNGRDKMTLDLQRVMDERASSPDKKATLRFFVKT